MRCIKAKKDEEYQKENLNINESIFIIDSSNTNINIETYFCNNCGYLNSITNSKCSTCKQNRPNYYCKKCNFFQATEKCSKCLEICMNFK